MVNGAKACTFLQEYTVEEKLEEFQGCCVDAHIVRVADTVATNGDSCAVRAVLFQSDFTNNPGLAYFLPFVQWNIVVVNAEECVKHVWSWGSPLSQFPGRDGQAHWSTRYPMLSYTKGQVRAGNFPAYCWL